MPHASGLPAPHHCPSSALPEVRGPILIYPGYDVMSQQQHWDDATHRLILDRVHNVPAIEFFQGEELALVEAVVARVLPQDDRPPEQRVPIVPWLDRRLRTKTIDGFRFDDMPPEDEAWRLGLRGIDEVARLRHQRGFVELSNAEQDAVLRTIADGEPPGEIWQRLPPQRFWLTIVVRQVAGVYYAHPTSWNEIGYGGPAFPRGYAALNHGLPEPWEVREVRLYEIPD
jgi:hypothetical protein